MYQEDLSWGLFCSIALFHALDKVPCDMFIKYRLSSAGTHAQVCGRCWGHKRTEDKCLSFVFPERQKLSERMKVINLKIPYFVEKHPKMK